MPALLMEGAASPDGPHPEARRPPAGASKDALWRCFLHSFDAGAPASPFEAPAERLRMRLLEGWHSPSRLHFQVCSPRTEALKDARRAMFAVDNVGDYCRSCSTALLMRWAWWRAGCPAFEWMAAGGIQVQIALSRPRKSPNLPPWGIEFARPAVASRYRLGGSDETKVLFRFRIRKYIQ
ncbi:hypothetical protein B5K08_27470 [Rhizobium leguminosarum bv. trifolii]|uniref:Uncharacterized protein n=1 Tax=Rhizobium leguminosarum bv. trifolii TaxID=386 RepID=A0A3E1B1F1_RHILT|nr:hypothetical protein B5K08_27470 [Rhizobium leguminosarum bv. trifolii]RFB84310.1 hypothetical protein B5K10_27460 [Rhizobium leguminosarum bv. trifolii]